MAPIYKDEPWEKLHLTHPHSHYSNLPSLKKPENVIVKGDTYDFETPGWDWIAIKPTVAKALGWHLAEDGLFRWQDSHGTVMVESIWWTDGSVQHYSLLREVEVGEGWAVVCSSNAMDALLRHFGSLQRISRILRSQRSDDDPSEEHPRVRASIVEPITSGNRGDGV